MNHRTDATVLTIGHSNHRLEDLITLLRTHAVTAVADVRSAPYSRSNPHFNREALQDSLKLNRIAYVFLGRELGGRPDNPNCYIEGKVQYRKLAQTPLFRKGLDRILKGTRSHRIALLCAEAEPLLCHRAILVAQELAATGVPVVHIHSNGVLESHEEAMSRLVEMRGLPDKDLYRTKEQIIADACAAQEKRIAFDNEQLSEKASA
jgi:uncharacterized protein (DUF488 family)